jgi:hypothetical protein
MSATVKAEVLKLARLLRRDPETLSYLERLDPEDLRRFREQLTEMLFSAHAGALGRLAAASKLLPVGVTASIAERALGPVLTARIAGLLEPPRAVEVASKLSRPFLADVAAEIDPRRAGAVIALIPPHQIAEITHELVRRAEHVTIGSFVGRLTAEARLAALTVIDHVTLLHVAFVVEEEAGLNQMFADVAPEQRPELVEAAARSGLLDELKHLIGRLEYPLRRSYEELAAAGR